MRTGRVRVVAPRPGAALPGAGTPRRFLRGCRRWMECAAPPSSPGQPGQRAAGLRRRRWAPCRGWGRGSPPSPAVGGTTCPRPSTRGGCTGRGRSGPRPPGLWLSGASRTPAGSAGVASGSLPAAEARREAWGVRCVWVSGCAGGVSVCFGVFHPNPDPSPPGCGEGLNRPGPGGSSPPAGVKRAQAAAPCHPGSFLGSCHRFCDTVAYLSKTNPFIFLQATLIVFCDRIPVRFLPPASLPCRCGLMQWSEESCS